MLSPEKMTTIELNKCVEAQKVIIKTLEEWSAENFIHLKRDSYKRLRELENELTKRKGE